MNLRYPYGVPEDTRFIAVIGEDGTFFDLVNVKNVNKHLAHLHRGGYAAEVVSEESVPPCRLRDFTDGFPERHCDVSWKGGNEFYHNFARQKASRGAARKNIKARATDAKEVCRAQSQNLEPSQDNEAR